MCLIRLDNLVVSYQKSHKRWCVLFCFDVMLGGEVGVASSPNCELVRLVRVLEYVLVKTVLRDSSNLNEPTDLTDSFVVVGTIVTIEVAG